MNKYNYRILQKEARS